MRAISTYILEDLKDDLVSHGWLGQAIRLDEERRGDGSHLNYEGVLAELLSVEVEVGIAKSTSRDHVEFIAWKGSVNERISRAVECVNKAIGSDKEFAYWLCLRKNIDHYEGEETQDL